MKEPKVEIGKLYTGQHFQHFDTRAGTYWEVLPPITADNCRLQRALLAHAALGVAWPRMPDAPAMPPVAPAKPASEAPPTASATPPRESPPSMPPPLKAGHDEDASAVESERARIARRIEGLNAERVTAGLPRTVRI